jgi:NADH dehydrogenase [ubiquinone] 1 alpha subcomplex assembly factor 3
MLYKSIAGSRGFRAIFPIFGHRSLSGLGKGFDISSLEDRRTKITGYGDHTFQINDTVVRQSVVLLPKSFYLWNAQTFDDITLDNLSLFPLLFPTLEVLFIGCGERMPKLISPAIIAEFKKKGIVIEASSTVNAAATFNILAGEGRNVAAALLTLKPTPVDTDPLSL